MFRLINIMIGKINNQKFPAPRALSWFRVYHPSLAPRRTDRGLQPPTGTPIARPTPPERDLNLAAPFAKRRGIW